MSAPEPLVERLAGVLIAEGAGPGSSLHSWRCEHPDRYGECDCVMETAKELAAVVEQEIAAAKAEALRDAAREARERGDIGKEGGYEAWDWLAIRADQAASIARTPGESEAR